MRGVKPDVIRDRLQKAGPHLIRTSDGNDYRVEHPEFVMVGRFNIVIEQPDGILDVIDPVHIVSIRRIDTKAAA
jgi:hypothetical protein